MIETKHLTTVAELKDQGDEAGYLEAVISTFNVVDSDNDIVEPTAFTAGQEVPLVWDHDWSTPIGKGTISVTNDHAVFRGRLWLDTFDGEQAYRKIKNAGALQEYSWGFRILDADFAERDGKEVRVIKRTEVFEASPTLVGANRQTGTLSIKHDSPLPEQEDEIKALLATIIRRHTARINVRAKEGRVLSTANRERLSTFLAALRQGGDEIEALLAATEPAPRDDGKAALLAAIEYELGLARRLGVAVPARSAS